MSRYEYRDLNRRREQSNAMMMGLGGMDKFGVKETKKRSKVKVPPAVGRLKAKLCAKDMYGMHSLKRLLRIMDDNGDGVLTKEELKNGLEDLGVRINPVEEEAYEYFDRDQNGTISQGEFVRGLRGPLEKNREALIRATFDSLEKTHDDCVTLEELEMAFDPTGLPSVAKGEQSPPQALREFLRQWDSLEHDSEVTYPEFLEYFKNISASMETDLEFSQYISGVWHVHVSRRFVEEDPVEKDPISDPLQQMKLSESEEKLVRRHHLHHSTTNLMSDGSKESIYQSTAQMANAHPEGPRVAKAKIPNWIRYHGVTLCFSLYHKQTRYGHDGQFDPQTRTFKTTQQESFSIRRFVLKYFLEDDSTSILETTPGQASSQFQSRMKTPDDVKLPDLFVGNKVTIKGLPMHVVDMDKKARGFFKENFPDIRMPRAALEIPEDPGMSEQTIGNQPKREATKSNNRRGSGKAASGAPPSSSKFMEFDGKILQFSCVWDDPSLYGERRTFSLFFHLGDDTVELREINNRNSGRGRSAVFNLKRQKLPNPESTHAQVPYCPSDLKLGSTINVFGRVLQIVDCDAFTRQYYERCGVKDFDTLGNKDGQMTNKQTIPNETAPLNLYSSATDQKCQQIYTGIRAIMEQRSRFGTEFDQRRMLSMYLKRFCIGDEQDEGRTRLSQEGFKAAMAGFSCFGSDAELLYERGTGVVDGVREKIGIDVFVDTVYPGDQPTAVPIQAQSGAPVPPQKAPKPKEYSKKVQSLILALRNKLEVMTDFGEYRQQRQLLDRILKGASVDQGFSLTKQQFRGALAKLNCWESDAYLLFNSFDIDSKGTLPIRYILDEIV